jgi:hypothetical protein
VWSEWRNVDFSCPLRSMIPMTAHATYTQRRKDAEACAFDWASRSEPPSAAGLLRRPASRTPFVTFVIFAAKASASQRLRVPVEGDSRMYKCSHENHVQSPMLGFAE